MKNVLSLARQFVKWGKGLIIREEGEELPDCRKNDHSCANQINQSREGEEQSRRISAWIFFFFFFSELTIFRTSSRIPLCV